MKRFYHDNTNDWFKPFASIVVFLAVFFAFFLGISKVSEEAGEKQIESLHLAISRGIAHCYATEGHYPESLDYLKQYYGILYDSDKFFVDYQALGANLFPDVTVIEK